jgi:thiazole synthase
MSTAVETQSKKLIIAGREYGSRLIIGTGKYRSFDEMKAAHRASGAEMVTVAVRRVPLDRSTESFLDHLDENLIILPNTAGCYTAEEAIRTARLAREALSTDLIKLEVIGDQTTLFPDNEQTLEAARVLVREGFQVLPYFTDDLIMAKKLLDAGCAAVMPLAAPIGSGLGVQNPANLRIMREQLPDATIIVDAGVGTASDAAIAMELGADAVLMNTAIAEGHGHAPRHRSRTPRISGRPHAQTPLRLGVEPTLRRRTLNKLKTHKVKLRVDTKRPGFGYVQSKPGFFIEAVGI